MHSFVSESDFFSVRTSRGAEYATVKHTSVDTLSPNLIYQIESWSKGQGAIKDYLTPMEKGKEWLFELTVGYQPRTGALLEKAGPLWIREFPGKFPSALDMGVTLGDCVVLIYRDFRGYNPSDEAFREYCPTGGRAYSLPEPIRRAYYERFDGLDIPIGGHRKPATQLLPFPRGRPWVSWDVYLEQFRGYKGKYLDWLKERIPNVAPKRKSDRWTNFMMFLDTRPLGDKGKEGDVLFVKNHIQDGVIYHIKDADIENMRILEFSAEAIDSYCEHILLQKSGRFDFMPFTREM